jgi:hypothetical protein
MRDGVYTGINLKRQNERSLFDASASHIGYRDQRYGARFIGSRVKINFDWQSIPLNYSYLTRTPFTISGNTLTLDNSAQNPSRGRPTRRTTAPRWVFPAHRALHRLPAAIRRRPARR